MSLNNILISQSQNKIRPRLAAKWWNFSFFTTDRESENSKLELYRRCKTCLATMLWDVTATKDLPIYIYPSQGILVHTNHRSQTCIWYTSNHACLRGFREVRNLFNMLCVQQLRGMVFSLIKLCLTIPFIHWDCKEDLWCENVGHREKLAVLNVVSWVRLQTQSLIS